METIVPSIESPVGKESQEDLYQKYEDFLKPSVTKALDKLKKEGFIKTRNVKNLNDVLKECQVELNAFIDVVLSDRVLSAFLDFCLRSIIENIKKEEISLKDAFDLNDNFEEEFTQEQLLELKNIYILFYGVAAIEDFIHGEDPFTNEKGVTRYKHVEIATIILLVTYIMSRILEKITQSL